MGALRVGNLLPYRPITTEKYHFRRTIVTPKESFKLLFPRVQTPRYVPDNRGRPLSVAACFNCFDFPGEKKEASVLLF
jgi:hypothetical protein